MEIARVRLDGGVEIGCAIEKSPRLPCGQPTPFWKGGKNGARPIGWWSWDKLCRRKIPPSALRAADPLLERG
ncbi:hypothetical protein A2Y83_04660 [Candidatus Falkowbacteria bacterium RBG_13_39_14]|uniref:Uncharacterized protein n=1 Tax=Candidatus Falkowbacteria bacterium RBG_13_39_14 TaxID=1797985 RepID=A0A1F5S6M3_9BACT|nr:MAG: hypothetical protein A2Y83_04660 [Candidatus Falkowbacteria bacterium RBG_13_39_14]